MRAVFGNAVATATEMQGHFRPAEDKVVTRKFGAVARLLWPFKTAAHIAAIAGVDERTAKRWLAGEFDPPLPVVFAVMDEIFRKQ
jgi:hypothetical protein